MDDYIVPNFQSTLQKDTTNRTGDVVVWMLKPVRSNNLYVSSVIV